MNKYISLILMDKLKDLEYIDKYGGVVQTIKKVTPVAGKPPIVRRIPVSAIHTQAQGCDLVKHINLHFIPQSKLKGLFYFEDQGVTLDTSRRHTMLTYWKSKLRLIVWLNQKDGCNYEYDNQLVPKAIADINQILSFKPVNYETFKQFSVNVVSIPPATSALFPYDYDEKETQFLMPPYDYFAMDLEIRFGIGRGCVPVIPPPLYQIFEKQFEKQFE